MRDIFYLKTDSLVGLEEGSELARKIDSLLDQDRLAIVKRLTCNSSGCATARGVGLLLQYAAQRVRSHADEKCVCIRQLTVDYLLETLKAPIDLQYRRGKEGKPYWIETDLPFFNVSHSAGLVILALSDSEIGIDIQKIKGKNELNMAKRFYSEHEVQLVDADAVNNYRIFYKLWARKEALGKCTGDGVRPYLNCDVSNLDADELRQFSWQEWMLEECFVCACERK